MMNTTPTEIANAFRALGKGNHSLEVIENMITKQRQLMAKKKKPKRRKRK